MCEKYSHFGHFRTRIIEPSIEEINNKTDLNVTYEYFTEGKMLNDFIFYKAVEDRLNIDRKIRKELDERCE